VKERQEPGGSTSAVKGRLRHYSVELRWAVLISEIDWLSIFGPLQAELEKREKEKSSGLRITAAGAHNVSLPDPQHPDALMLFPYVRGACKAFRRSLDRFFLGYAHEDVCSSRSGDPFMIVFFWAVADLG